MHECVIIGQPNAGKTLFALSFASFLGNKSATLTCRTPDGILSCRQINIEKAKKELCSPLPYKTCQLQSMLLTLPVKKASVSFKFSDTCGLIDEIHDNANLRSGMAQTLSLVHSAGLIFHVIDAASIVIGGKTQISRIDHELYRYGMVHPNYVLLANKIDLPVAYAQLPQFKQYFPSVKVIPISALYQQGYRSQMIKNIISLEIQTNL
jgi:GTPase involved in cell partitioning and DNA repair